MLRVMGAGSRGQRGSRLGSAALHATSGPATSWAAAAQQERPAQSATASTAAGQEARACGRAAHSRRRRRHGRSAAPGRGRQSGAAGRQCRRAGPAWRTWQSGRGSSRSGRSGPAPARSPPRTAGGGAGRGGRVSSPRAACACHGQRSPAPRLAATALPLPVQPRCMPAPGQLHRACKGTRAAARAAVPCCAFRATLHTCFRRFCRALTSFFSSLANAAHT